MDEVPNSFYDLPGKKKLALVPFKVLRNGHFFLVDTASTAVYRIQILIIVFSTIVTLPPLTSAPDFLPVLQFTADQSIIKAWTPDLLYGSAGPHLKHFTDPDAGKCHERLRIVCGYIRSFIRN